MTEESFQHGDEEIRYTSQRQPGAPPQVVILPAEHIAMLTKRIPELSQLVEAYVPNLKRKVLVPELLDVLFAKWLNDESNKKMEPDDVVKILGAAYGEIFRINLKMRWVQVQDEHGSDTALWHEQSNAFVFPFDIIWKRIESGEIDFFRNIFLLVVDKIIKKNQK